MKKTLSRHIRELSSLSRVGRTTFMIGLFTAALCALSFTVGCKGKEAPPPKVVPEVTVVTVKAKTIPAVAEFVAQTESSHKIDIVARVNGFLEKILYREGDVIKKGQVMFLMDQKPFKAQVDAAKGELERRQAQLWTAQANLARIRPLAEQNAASQSDLDNAIGSVQAAEAAVYEATARLDKAELDLSYTEIESPVTGMSGRSLMREGQYLSSFGPDSALTDVVQLDPIWINFSVSLNQMAGWQDEVTKGRLITPKDSEYDVEIELSDGSKYPHKGRVSFAAPSFSAETGTFLVRSVFPNPKLQLRPGMFVKAYLKGAKRPNAITVPQKAVQQTSNGHVVYVVNESGQAELRPVYMGDWFGDEWIVLSGLKDGERVIVEGFMGLPPGTPVKAVEAGAMQDESKTGAKKEAGPAEQAGAPSASPAGK